MPGPVRQRGAVHQLAELHDDRGAELRRDFSAVRQRLQIGGLHVPIEQGKTDLLRRGGQRRTAVKTNVC